MLTFYVAFGLAMVVAMIATPIITTLAHHFGWYDMPVGGRKVHTTPIPRLGGIAVSMAFFTPLLALAIYPTLTAKDLFQDTLMFQAFLIGACSILLLGIYDDLRGASPKLKLLVQVVVAFGMWKAGFDIEYLGIPFIGAVDVGWMDLPLTLLWFVGVINALNLIDGLDGLASGISLFAAAVLFGVGLLDNQHLPSLLMAALGGALVGFLFFNFNPARIFLGDSGSMFLGFALAATSVWTGRKGATAVALLVPMLALAVPLLDTTLSVVRRVSRGQSPFHADGEHLHHRLMALGLTHRNAVLTLYVLSATLGLAGLALLRDDATTRTIVFAAAGSIVVLVVHRIGVFQFPGLFRKNAEGVIEVRDKARELCRSIRRSGSLDEVWSHVLEFLTMMPAAEVYLGWPESMRSLTPANEFGIYRWMRRPDQAPELDANVRVTNRIVQLEICEGKRIYGDCYFLFARRAAHGQDHDIMLQLLREAIIDFCVANAPPPEPKERTPRPASVIGGRMEHAP